MFFSQIFPLLCNLTSSLSPVVFQYLCLLRSLPLLTDSTVEQKLLMTSTCFWKDVPRKEVEPERSAACMWCTDTQTLAGLRMQMCGVHARSHTPTRGACWDKFRRVDLPDNDRATLINAGLQFLSPSLCVCCKSLYLKAGLFTFLYDGGWKILPILCAQICIGKTNPLLF